MSVGLQFKGSRIRTPGRTITQDLKMTEEIVLIKLKSGLSPEVIFHQPFHEGFKLVAFEVTGQYPRTKCGIQVVQKFSRATRNCLLNPKEALPTKEKM